MPFYQREFAYVYNIKSIMNDTPLTKLINLKELTLLLDWLRTSPDRKTLMASAAKKYSPLLKNLSPEQIYSKAQNRNIKINNKQTCIEGRTVGSMERWDFNEYTIFVWISAYLSIKENVQLQQMTRPHFQTIQRIFANKSLPFIQYNIRNLKFVLDKKNEEWETEEISMLQTIMKKFGDRPDWKLASFDLFCQSKGRFFRPVPQCRQKWLNYLNPNVKKDKWTHEEDTLLFTLIDELGCQWSKISKSFKQTRNQHSVKNRYNYFKKQWRKNNQTSRAFRIAPIIKKVLKNYDYDYKQDTVSPSLLAKDHLSNKDIFHQNSSSEFLPDITESPIHKVYKSRASEYQPTSMDQKTKETQIIENIDISPSSKENKKLEIKTETVDGSCLQFDLSAYFLWMNGSVKSQKQLEQKPKLLLCPEMSTSHEIQADVARILGYSHFEAIQSHEEWMRRMEEEENMQWID